MTYRALTDPGRRHLAAVWLLMWRRYAASAGPDLRPYWLGQIAGFRAALQLIDRGDLRDSTR